MNDVEFYRRYEPLLREVRSYFTFSPQPHTSASSPDKPRYHIYSGLDDKHLLFDTEEELKEFIHTKHKLLSEEDFEK